jgi:hypothetical protein
MIRALLLGLTLGAGPALAQDFTEEQKATFIAVLAANGCKMTEAEGEVALPAAGIDRNVTWRIANDLEARGEASLSEDMQTFTLAPEICP